MLQSVDWSLATDVSGQPISRISLEIKLIVPKRR